MRIDLYLKKTLIITNRAEAKTLCEKNLVRVNGKEIKPAKTVNDGDTIEIETHRGTRKIKVIKVPDGNIRKDETSLYYEEIF